MYWQLMCNKCAQHVCAKSDTSTCMCKIGHTGVEIFEILLELSQY